MVLTALREKKTYTDKTKLNPAARDDTLRCKDTKRSVCARNWTVFILFLRSNCPELVHTTAGVWRVFFLLYGGSQTYKCITATYLSNEPLTLYLQFQLGVSMVHLTDIDWHFMTDRLQRFELKIFVFVLLKKQCHLHLGCLGGKQINIQFKFWGELSF